MPIAMDINRLKAEALSLGFYACGVARSGEVDKNVSEAFSLWLEKGRHGEMAYMADNRDKRLDTNLLLTDAKSVIVVAMNYYPRQLLNNSQLQFAYYAYGKDYHDVMRKRLKKLAEICSIRDVRHRAESHENVEKKYQGLICCDTVPVLERYWAWKAGIGWIGKNNSLIIPNAGSFFFLGIIITELEFTDYATPMQNLCGKCENCLKACPTGALSEPFLLDASKCLSYLTIEYHGDIPEVYASKMNNTVYGCDRCQQCCPHNRFATPTEIEEFNPTDEFLNMTDQDWINLTEEDYRRIFKGSAVKRAKYAGLKRNIDAIS